jgi:hypothetical protein
MGSRSLINEELIALPSWLASSSHVSAVRAFMQGRWSAIHHAPPPVQAARDAIADETPLLQKVVGKSAPGEILKQLAAINAAEQRFAGIREGAGR